MKHHKGPWSFDFHGINQAGTGLRIAKLSQPAYDHSSGQPKRVESFDGDGHLLAASPTMLDALEMSTTTLETIYLADPQNIAAKKCIERNREAIAKAKGEGGTDV